MNLYHSSPIKGLKVIQPQRTICNDEYTCDFVFATKYKKLALMYMLPKGVYILMNINYSSKPYVLICGREEDVIKLDKGGSLYTFSDKGFIKTPQEKLDDYEMVSEQPVMPIKEIVYDKTIDVLMKIGVSIYFVNKKTFDLLMRSPKQDSLVEKLTKYKPLF